MRRTALFVLSVIILATAPAVAQVCQPGYFAPGGVAPCSPCPVGSFTADAGSEICSVCPVGTFQPNVGSAQCQTCPDGYIAPFLASSACEPCPPGFTSNASHTECVEETVSEVATTWGLLKATYR